MSKEDRRDLAELERQFTRLNEEVVRLRKISGMEKAADLAELQARATKNEIIKKRRKLGRS